MGKLCALIAFCLVSTSLIRTRAEECGRQAGGALCPGGLCCSQFGWCGNTAAYCDHSQGCQLSQCWGGPTPTPPPSQLSGSGVGSIISRELFEQMLMHWNDAICPAKNLCTYDPFINAANAFGSFGNTVDLEIRKGEIAAFLAQTSHETTGGWPGAPDGPYTWGYCIVEEVGPAGNCSVISDEWPCARDKKYYGRGPMQISYEYNYRAAGEAIGVDLLNNPDLVAEDPVISFKTAFWFWMTPQFVKPSCHDVITGGWTPSPADLAAGRVPGYGLLTNIINGGVECGRGSNPEVESRIGFYKRYCGMLGVNPGDNIDCYGQRPYAFTSHLVLPSS